jgi:hypothetical protein
MLLRELENASLIQQHAPSRYRMHDLVRLYTTDTVHQVLGDNSLTAAIRRVLQFYLPTAHACDRVLDPHAQRIRFDPPDADVRPDTVADHATAMGWFIAEYPCLLAALRTAVDRGWDSIVWQMAWVLHTFQQRQGHLQNNLASWRAGHRAAERLEDRAVQVLASRMVGAACARAGRHREAAVHLRRALGLAEQAGDLPGPAHTHRSLAWTWERLGDQHRAFEHATHALRLIRVVGDTAREADMLNDVGWYACRLDSYEMAWLHCASAGRALVPW